MPGTSLPEGNLLDLARRIADMVIAVNDMGDAHVHSRQLPRRSCTLVCQSGRAYYKVNKFVVADLYSVS
jgi:hypothetical protein